jgi:hypothetical protein
MKPDFNRKLRNFIFLQRPQPLDLPVFIQNRTGEPGRRQEASFQERRIGVPDDRSSSLG